MLRLFFSIFMVSIFGWLPGAAMAGEPDWTPYRQLLSRYVVPGELQGIKLNTLHYSALRSDPLLNQAVAIVETFPVQQLQTREEKLSFYINAYNILAIKMIRDHWPVDSIKDAGHWYSPVWKKDAGTIDGETVTLQQVEDDFLRSLHEPRIHLAIVCASISCPDLRMKPYRAASLNQQLDDQAKRFLANPGKGLRIDGETAHVSRIFHWFKDDFKVGGGVEAFIRRYHPLPQSVNIEADIDYNWQLNGS